MHYLSLTEDDRQQLLREIGVRSFEDLLKPVPQALRNPPISLLPGLSELEVQRLIDRLGEKNVTTKDFLSFLGGGSYERFIPPAVFDIAGRQEFLTAYTPYQPEASQGTLQAIFEYQSLIAELTGLAASNASHYDGATSLAEAALAALKHTERNKILVARSVHPHFREVLKTYFLGSAFTLEEIAFRPAGDFDPEDLFGKLDGSVAGVIFQTPNFLGVVEDLTGIAEKVRANGSLLILTGDLLACGVYRSPGEWGADIAAGEGQSLGIPMVFGGPYLGYFAAAQTMVRRIPGRLAGMTEDADGKRAFCLTLQAREQHIRRERAASNICSNQALCALTACVYMTLLGKQGIRRVAELNLDRANYLRSQISNLRSFEADLSRPIFNEFMVASRKPFAKVEQKLLEKKIFAGIPLARFYPELKDRFLVCATETKSKEDLDRFVGELDRC